MSILDIICDVTIYSNKSQPTESENVGLSL